MEAPSIPPFHPGKNILWFYTFPSLSIIQTPSLGWSLKLGLINFKTSIHFQFKALFPQPVAQHWLLWDLWLSGMGQGVQWGGDRLLTFSALASLVLGCGTGRWKTLQLWLLWQHLPCIWALSPWARGVVGTRMPSTGRYLVPRSNPRCEQPLAKIHFFHQLETSGPISLRQAPLSLWLWWPLAMSTALLFVSA